MKAQTLKNLENVCGTVDSMRIHIINDARWYVTFTPSDIFMN
jgi:hypothetical protein